MDGWVDLAWACWGGGGTEASLSYVSDDRHIRQ